MYPSDSLCMAAMHATIIACMHSILNYGFAIKIMTSVDCSFLCVWEMEDEFSICSLSIVGFSGSYKQAYAVQPKCGQRRSSIFFNMGELSASFFATQRVLRVFLGLMSH